MAAGFDLRADAVHTAGALFKRARVPIEVVVYDVAAETMQIDALGHDAGRDAIADSHDYDEEIRALALAGSK